MRLLLISGDLMNELCGVRAVRAVRRRDAVRVFVCLNRRTRALGNWATQHVRQTLRLVPPTN